MAKRILIAGCGDIGSAVGRALVAQGHEVTGLRRNVVTTDTRGIYYCQADLTRPESLCDLPTDFDLMLIIVTPSERSEAGYKNIYLQGVANLLQHFTNHNACNIPVIYVSSTRVYGQQCGEWIDEGCTTEPADAYGRILLQAEQQVLAHNEVSTIVRFSGIYGRNSQFETFARAGVLFSDKEKAHEMREFIAINDRLSTLLPTVGALGNAAESKKTIVKRSQLMQKLAEQGKPIQHNPPSFTNRVHRDDCVGSLTFLANKVLEGEPLASHYLVSDDEPAPKWDVISWLAGQAGLPAPPKEDSDLNAGQGKRCSNQRIREAGYVFKYPSFREGYRNGNKS